MNQDQNSISHSGLPIKHLIAILSVFMVSALAVYSNTLHSPFVFDDDGFILSDRHIRMTALSWDTIAEAALEGRPRHRLLPNISFAFNYYLGQYDVAGYHMVNMLIHLVAGILLFFLFKATLTIARGPDSATGTSLLIPFFAALIWMVHPVNTQAVTYVCQRMTAMAAMFYILAMLFYVRARMAMRAEDAGRLKPVLRFAGCIIAGLCAVASKENAGALPLFILLYEWFFFQDLKPVRTHKRILWLIGGLAVFAVIALVYLGENPVNRIMAGYAHRDFTLSQRVMTEFRVVIYYIGLFFFPAPDRLTLEHGYPLSYSPVAPWTTLLSFAAIICLLGLAIKAAKKDRLTSFCILWFLGNLAIESSVIGIEIIFEHRTYLPFMMACLLFVLMVSRVIKKRTAAIGLLCAITAIASVWTFQRNTRWHDELTFYRDGVDKAPGKFRPHNNLGIALYNVNRFQAAAEQYRKALEINPAHKNAKDAFNNLGNALLKQYRIKAAINAFAKALQIDPNYTKALNNTGTALIGLKRYNDAVYYFLKILKQDEKNVEAHINIGVALTRLNRIDEAISHYQTALKLYPYHAEAYNNLGVLLIRKNRLDEARRCFNQALALNPDYASAKNNLEKLKAFIKQDHK